MGELCGNLFALDFGLSNALVFFNSMHCGRFHFQTTPISNAAQDHEQFRDHLSSPLIIVHPPSLHTGYNRVSLNN